MDKFVALRTFRRVVELGGFSAAARDLDLSNAAVSKHVRDLEQALGVTLLTRTTRTVRTTEAGRAYYERSTRALDELEAAELDLAALQSTPRGRLRIDAPMSFGLLHLAPLLGAFSERWPEVRVDLVLNDRFVDLIDEGFDVGLRVRRRLEDSSLVARRLCQTRLVLVASPAYLARHGRPERIDDLAAHRLLAYSLGDAAGRWDLTENGDVRWLELDPYLTANSSIAIRDATLAGMGVTLIPMFMVGEALRAGELVQVLPDNAPQPATVYAMYPPNRHLTPKVRAFVDFLAERFCDPPPWEG